MAQLTAIAGKRIYVDTNVFIYALEDVPEWRVPAQTLLCAIDAGHCEAVTSELTLCECLVKPFNLGRQDIAQAYMDVLQSRPSLSVPAVSREILIEAAKMRSTGMRLPDAVHAATALLHGCDCLVTNDARYGSLRGIQVLMLADIKRS